MTPQEANQGGAIKRIHTAFQKLTGRTTELDSHAWFVWEKWLVIHRFQEDDLELVVSFINKQNKEGKNYSHSFKNIIEDAAKFRDRLDEARATLRPRPKETPRQQVLRMTGRVEVSGKPYIGRPLKELVEAEMKKLKSEAMPGSMERLGRLTQTSDTPPHERFNC